MKKIILLILIYASSVLQAQTVYITNTGEKYRRSECRYLSKSKNAIELKDALGQGYVACKICKPPQTESRQIESEKTDSQNSNKESVSIQCSSNTKAGARCKRTTKSKNGKCWQHGGD